MAIGRWKAWAQFVGWLVGWFIFWGGGDLSSFMKIVI